MRAFLSGLIMPLPVFWILFAAAIIFWLLKRKKPAWWLLIISLVWLLIIITPFIPWVLTENLEDRYPALLDLTEVKSEKCIPIIVLGAGHTNDFRFPPNDQLSKDVLGRLVEGIRLHRLLPGSKLILSGFRGSDTLSQAEVLARTALSLGVEPADTFMNENPSNTRQEALECANRYDYYIHSTGSDSANSALPSFHTRKIIVVTNAMHMPRAMMLFKYAGLQPIPAPTNHLNKVSKFNKGFHWIPSSDNIQKMEAAIHEYIGIIWGKIEK